MDEANVVLSVVGVLLLAAAASSLQFPPQPANHVLSCLINPCIYGICVDSINGGINRGYSCYCIDGYTGVNCQTNWDECWSSPCQNGGTCHDGVAAYNCSCPDGFTGETCEENVDECYSNPCLNNGTCIDINNGYICHCLPGYYGVHCELDVAVCNSTEEERCMNGGLCIDGPGITFTCQCLPGWTGKLCQTAIDECASSPCKNGAVCVDMHATYACACPFGFTGKNCEVKVELCVFNTCENNALCIIEDAHSVCYCVPDYHGDRCQHRYDECQKGPGCLNGGSCIDGVDSYSCSCPPGLTGRYCQCLIEESGKLDCNYIRPTPYHTTPRPPLTVETFTAQTVEYGLSESTIPVEITTETVLTSELTELPLTSTKQSTNLIEWTSVSTQFELTQMSQTFPTESLTETSTKSEGSTQEIVYMSERITTESELYTAPRYSTGIPTETSTASEITSESKLSTTIDVDERKSTESSSEMTSTSRQPTTDEGTTTSEISQTDLGPESRTLPTDSGITEESVPTGLTDLLSTEQTLIESSTVQMLTTPFPNCDQEPCKNGGTCYYSKTGPKCECKFGWTGERCGEEAGIKIAAFTGDSLLVHRLSNTSSGVVVTVTMRSLASQGLVLYASTAQSVYMAVYIQEGHLRFQFSCGVKSMLLSQLYEPVNTGHSLTIMAMIEFVPVMGMRRQCSGLLRVNNSLAMSGEQPAAPEPSQAYGILYLGGLPVHILHQIDLPVKNGITACMYNLEIDGEKKEIYGDAIDGMTVSECSSLACLSSPCLNGGSCIESGYKWHCHCSTGYVGVNCEDSVCKNNPCNYGGTCVQYPGSGFVCLCPLGKHGLYCDQDLEVGQPYFSSSIGGLSSYTAYPLPGAIHHSFELRFNFIPSTLDQIALMVFIGQNHPHDSTSDHLSVSFIKGYIVLTWNLGSGPRRIFTPQPIADSGRGKTMHSVKLGRLGQEGWLQVDNMPNITGTSPGWLSQLNTEPTIFIGGYETKNFSGLPHDLPLHKGYSGCLFNVELRAGRVRLSLQRSRDAVGRNIGQCSTSHCHNSTCLHAGACLDHAATFSCLCQDGWFGPECTMKYNPCDSTRHQCSEGSTCVPLSSGYECDCPLGKTGKHCQIDEPLSDVSFTGKRSYLSIDSVDMDKPEICIDLELKPISERGIVLFSQQTQGPAITFVSLSLQGGILELRIAPLGGQRRAGDVLIVRSGRVLAMGEWTRVRAGRYGRRIFLWVDGTVNAGNLLPGETLLPGNKPLYIGGVPDLSELPTSCVAGLPVPLKGCVRRLWLNWEEVPLNMGTIKEGRNLFDCDGTLCGADQCRNGGTCHLVGETSLPTCSCPKYFQGERCETQVSCKEVGCENSGRCISMGSSVKCHCPTGWTGPLCTKEVPRGAPHFGGDGYLVVDPTHGLAKRGGAKLQTERTPISYIYLNFTTAHTDGLILWTSKDEEYLGVGVENGLMKVVWGQEDERGHGNAVLLPGATVSDGNWHSLSLSLQPENLDYGNLTLAADTHLTQSYSPFPQVFTDGVFYLGGFPEERSILDETVGNFKTGFKGCIKEFAWGEQSTITDFTKYEGENLSNCEMFHP